MLVICLWWFRVLFFGKSFVAIRSNKKREQQRKIMWMFTCRVHINIYIILNCWVHYVQDNQLGSIDGTYPLWGPVRRDRLRISEVRFGHRHCRAVGSHRRDRTSGSPWHAPPEAPQRLRFGPWWSTPPRNFGRSATFHSTRVSIDGDNTIRS